MNTSLRPEIVRDEKRFFELRSHWQELFHPGGGGAATVLSWWWQSLWWRMFGGEQRGRELRVIVMWRGSQAAAIFPLYIERTRAGAARLRFISCGPADGESLYPEYLDALYANDYRHEILAAFSTLLRRALPWDILTLERFDEGSLIHSLMRRQPLLSRSRWSMEVSPYADLSEGFEAYLAGRSANSRSRFRRLLRAGDGLRLESASTHEAALSFFREMAELHQQRWNAEGLPGAFADAKVRLFHENLLSVLTPGAEVVLTRLSDAQGPLALLYGFRLGAKFDFYQSGVCRDGRVASPGILAHLLTMRRLAAEGVTVYDFLAGEADYKTKLATAASRLYSVSTWRCSTRSLLEAGCSVMRRCLSRPAIPPARVSSVLSSDAKASIPRGQ